MTDPWLLFMQGFYVALGVLTVAGPFTVAHAYFSRWLSRPRIRVIKPEISFSGDPSNWLDEIHKMHKDFCE
jgi:hypothetical protein